MSREDGKPHRNVLRLDGLSKHFGALAVTREVTLAVRGGEIHALIGPNGAGKSTLMAQIAGQLRPDAGRVWLGDEDVTTWSPQRRARAGLARTFQISSVFRSMTARENVALALGAQAGRASWWTPFSAAVDAEPPEAELDRLGFTGGDAPASQLDYGAVRQIELAMGLAMAPKVLLLDEPLAGLSPAEARQAVAVLQGLRGRYPMLLIEHDMDAVFTIADRISVLVSGAVIATGTPEQIRQDAQVRDAYLGQA